MKIHILCHTALGRLVILAIQLKQLLNPTAIVNVQIQQILQILNVADQGTMEPSKHVTLTSSAFGDISSGKISFSSL